MLALVNWFLVNIVTTMTIHIGHIIQSRVKDKMTVTEFAGRLNYSRQSVYDIFEKTSIDTELLSRIGEVLGENLFYHYIPDPPVSKLIKVSNTLQDLINEMQRKK